MFRSSRRAPRVLHLQFSDPSGYPPIQHATRLLCEAGFECTLLAVRGPGQSSELRFPSIEGAQVRYVGTLDRVGGALFSHYMAVAWREALRLRPDWCYVSDAPVTPFALAITEALRIPVVYHEHDSPCAPTTRFTRLYGATRARLTRSMAVGVLPNAQRIDVLRAETQTRRPIECVWNCPSAHEIAAPRSVDPARPMRLIFQGSIVPDRLPETLIDALAEVDGTELHVCGYETQGSVGYVDRLRARANVMGVGERFVAHGALADRDALLAITRRCDVGLAFVTDPGGDVNMRFMTGASNKPFDYLSQGVPLMVTDDAAWRAFMVDPGFARAARVGDRESLIQAIRWYRDNPDARIAMGERGRQRVLSEWNYGAQFRPVLDLMRARVAKSRWP